jgi:hypothetical protein
MLRKVFNVFTDEFIDRWVDVFLTDDVRFLDGILVFIDKFIDIWVDVYVTDDVSCSMLSKASSLGFCWRFPMTSSISSWWTTSHHCDSSCSNSCFFIECFSDVVVVQKFGCSSSLSFNRFFSSNCLSGCSDRFFE